MGVFDTATPTLRVLGVLKARKKHSQTRTGDLSIVRLETIWVFDDYDRPTTLFNMGKYGKFYPN
jgi:hypothetical protein